MQFRVLVSLLAAASLFGSGLFVGWYYTAKDYQADIAIIERDHADDLAEQVSLEAALLADAYSERDRREQDYVKALGVLNRQLEKQRQAVRLSRNKLDQLERVNEKIRDLGASPTPDDVVEWLR